MAYTKQTWTNGVSKLNATRMQHIEDGLEASAIVADAAIPQAISGVATDKVPVYNGSAWVAQKLVNAQIDAAAAIDISKLASYPADNTKFLRGDATWAVPTLVSARLVLTTTQSIANNSFVAVTFTTESWDDASMHDNVSNTSRLVAPATGRYMAFGTIAFVANSTGIRQTAIRANGTDFLGYHAINATSSGVAALSTSTIVALNANEYVELIAFQSSGAALNLTGSSSTPITFALARLA